MSPTRALLIACLLPTLALAGCLGGASPASDAPRDPPVVSIVATDFALEAPEFIPAGIVEVVIENRGEEWHHVTFVKLEEGHTLADLREAMIKGHGAIPPWARAFGGPNVAVRGEAPTKAILDLDPGVYVLLCLIPSFDHRLHLEKGMMKLVTVAPDAKAAPAAIPAPTHTATLDDFSFALDAPVKAGKSVLRVVNTGQHTHELVLFELFGNATTMEYLTLLEDPNTTFDAPGRAVGGTTPISPGETVLLPVDLPAGRYTFVCFDTAGTPENAPHLVHGMVHEFGVR